MDWKETKNPKFIHRGNNYVCSISRTIYFKSARTDK